MFLAFTAQSAVTYSKVIVAQQRIVLEDPVRTASILPNGTLKIEFSVSVANPSDYAIHIWTLSWYTEVDNSTGSPPVIPVATQFYSEGYGLTIPAKETKHYVFDAYVTDRGTIRALNGYLNHTGAQGSDASLERIPYGHSFDIRGWLDGFKHDYFKEEYLNQLVQVELRYTYPEVTS